MIHHNMLHPCRDHVRQHLYHMQKTVAGQYAWTIGLATQLTVN